MANEINIKVKIGDDGSLKLVAKDAQKAAKSIDKVSTSTEKAAKSRNTYQKQEKGVAGATSNSTKSFSKMTSNINGGLVPAYATLAANVFAVTAAFGVLQRAAAVQQLEAGLMAVGRAAGANLKLVADSLREVTDLAVSTQAAMESTAIATSAGFSEQQIKSLGEVAKGTSLALGRDMTDALTRLIRGTSKLEPELLDELGIFVKLGNATEEYADKLGKPVATLTEFERRQAFVNAAIDEGTRKFGRLNGLVDANPYDKLAASFNDLTKIGLNFANTVLTPIVGFLAEAPVALLGLFGIFASGIVSQITPSIQASAEIAKRKSEELAYRASKSSKVVSEDYKKAAKNVRSSWKTVPDSVAKLESKFKKGTHSAQELKTAITRLAQSEKLRANAAISTDKETANRRARELKEVRQLKTEMIALQQAEAKRFTASSTGAGAKGSSSSAALTSRGLQQMDRSTSLMQKFSIAARYSGLQMQTVAKASTAGAKGANLLGVGLRAAAGSARMFGSAILSAIPVLGQIIMVGALVWEAFKWMFQKKPTLLDEELDRAQERYAEFPNIVSQMAVAYGNATTRAEAFAEAMRPGVGLLKQTKDQINAIIDAEKGAATAKVIEAQKAKIKADMALAAARKANVNTGVNGDFDDVEGPSNSVVGVVQSTDDLKAAALAAAKALKDAQNFKRSQEAVDGVIQGVLELTASTKALQDQTVQGSSEWVQYEERLGATQEILNKLSNNDVEGAIQQLNDLTTVAVAQQDAFDSSSETVTKFANAVTASKQATGAFATVITLLTEANNKLAGDLPSETISEYTKIFDQFGITYEKTIAGKEKNDLFTPEEIASLNAAKVELQQYTDKLKAFNEADKLLGRQQAISAENARQLAGAGLDNAANMLKLSKASAKVKHEQNELDLAQVNKATTIEELERLKLSVLKAQTAELQLQEQIRAKEIERRAASLDKVSSTGGTAIRNTEDIKLADDKVAKLKADPETDPKVLAQAEADAIRIKIEAASSAFKSISEDMAKIGPEGELMSAATGGISLIANTFTTAFDVIGDKSASMADKVQAGLAAGMAVMQTFAAVSKASSDAKIRGIDQEIAAEKKRDGQSAQSLAKISALEKKKEKEQRKAFEVEKKMKMGQTIISTAQGAMAAYTSLAAIPIVGPALGAAAAAMVVAMGAKQLSMISSTSFQGGGSTGGASAPASISVGSRTNTTDLAKSTGGAGELGYFRGQSGVGGPENFTPAFTGMKYRASGGQTTGFMVGEQGPELFVPEKPGRIVPADEVGSGGAVNANITIQAVDADGVEDVLRRQRGNIIGMLREAANANGENFLESVNLLEQ